MLNTLLITISYVVHNRSNPDSVVAPGARHVLHLGGMGPHPLGYCRYFDLGAPLRQQAKRRTGSDAVNCKQKSPREMAASLSHGAIFCSTKSPVPPSSAKIVGMFLTG